MFFIIVHHLSVGKSRYRRTITVRKVWRYQRGNQNP